MSTVDVDNNAYSYYANQGTADGSPVSTLVDPVSTSQVLHPALVLQNALYVDINPMFNTSTSPALLLTDSYAIVHCSLANLMRCWPGGRSRIFLEDYHSPVFQFLQEPMCEQTAVNLQMGLSTAISKWEPRISLIAVRVTLSPEFHGYNVLVLGNLINTNKPFSANYSIPV